MGGEGFSGPESRQEVQKRLEGESHVEKQPALELIVDISEADLHESQSSYAVGKGFENFGEMPAIERAEFWVIENNVSDNYLKAEAAAKEAGLDREAQLGYKIRALEARMSALARSIDKKHIKEFHRLDEINAGLKEKKDKLPKLNQG